MRPGLLIACMALLALVAAAPGHARAQPGDDAASVTADDDRLLGTGAIDARIAVMSFDALGMEAELVARLESLFRNELERLSQHPLPGRRKVQDTVQGSRSLRRCSGENACLARIGKALGVDAVVSGNVAALGDSYILNIKVVSAQTGAEIRRLTTEPLRGDPDELIEAMRVAAYRLLAPEQLLGSMSVLTDLVGASVKLDGEPIGTTPLPGPVYRLPLGSHALRVEAPGFLPFEETVEVRFQKTTRVAVRLAELADPMAPGARPGARDQGPVAWYGSTWFHVSVAVAASLVGGTIGYLVARDTVIDCGARPEACGGN